MFALFCVPWAANAQETVTIGDGTQSAYQLPVNTYYNYSLTQQIYTADEITAAGGSAGTISSISFYYTYSTGYTMSDVQVYMLNTDKEKFESTTDMVAVSAADKVFEGSFTLSANNWSTITLDEEFEYEGGNLLICFFDPTNGYPTGGSSCKFRYTTTTEYTSITYYDDNTCPNINNVTSFSGYNKNRYQYHNNIQLVITPSSGNVCEKPATLEYSNVTLSSADLSWTGGSGVYNIELNGNIIEQSYQGSTYNLTNLEAATSYTVKVQSVCGEETSGWKTMNFTTPCDVVTTFPWSEDFESYSASSNGIKFEDLCWENIHLDGTGTYFFEVYSGTQGTNGTKQLRLHDMSSGTMTKLRLPEMVLPTGDSYLFSIDVYRVNATSYTGEGIRVYASTDGEIEGATELAFISRNFGTGDGNLIPAESAADWYTYELPIPFTGTCYIVLRGESKYGSATYMDNFKVKKELPCVKPSDPTFVSSTTTSATLSWTNGAEGQTAWQIAYSTNPNFNPDEVTPVDVTSNPGTINGLTASTNYYAYVRANCGDLGYSEWSTAYCQFATACDVIAALGYSENFDSYTAGNNVLPTCWNYINTTTYSSYQVYPRVYANSSYSTYANTAPNCLYLYSYAYYSSGTTTYDPQPQYAILPEMTDLAGKQVTLMARGYNATSTFKIGTMSDPTDVGTFQLIAEQALTTSYDEYSFIVNQEGNYLAIMIDAANESRTSNGAYIDDISIDNAPSCFKPSSPMLETPASRTAHTATLKWTNGEEGQSAWQIAYSTSATFAPAADFTPGENEWLVDADANPYTLYGLQANTTYYAYVRANCGNGDLSAWSRTKATFTTTAANAAPTGLAVDASSITSESATVTWTGVATNDYHDSYELYFSTETTMPEELVAENLITGITAESYELTHLEAETPYYVWVRDNCGNDGLSVWSSRASFTTASSCQTPDGLAESNVTNESATITWNTYGLTEFNLRYGTDGENWTVEENVNNSYVINGLNSNTTYQVQVQATCADAQTWSTVLSFTTACDAITSFPWSEDFESYNASNNGITFSDPCWVNEHISGNGSYFFEVYSGTNGTNSTKQLRLRDMSSGTMTKLMLPEMTLPGDDYLFSIDVYRNATSYAEEGIRVFASTDGEIEGATELAFISRNFDTGDGNLIPAENATDWYTYELPIGFSGTCYIILRGESKYGSHTYMDNFAVKQMPSCAKPTNLEATVNVLSATITWVSEAGEYEVAYSTDNTANPDENIAGPATEETYTMNGLALGDHYFWVRANCGSNGYSEWVGPVSAHIGYCVPTPSNVDGNGISNVTFGMGDNIVNNTTPKATYADYSSQIGAVQAGVESTIAITYATGYDYGTIIWVDLDKSLSFEDSEIVYTGTSGSANPTTLNAAITIPATQTPGDYMMRIGGADSGFDSYINDPSTTAPSACYTGNWACFQDYTLRVLEAPSCMMPTDLAVNYTGGTEATISWTSDAEAWNMRVNGVDVNGIITNPYLLTGLELATTYSVEVQANCGEDGTSEWSNAVSFTTDFCMPENQCEISYSFYDQYNDSWNGAYMNIVDAATQEVLYELTMPDVDSPYEGSFNVCDGRDIQFVWVRGSYPTECGYEFTHNGETILEKATNSAAPDAGVVLTYTVNCSSCTIGVPYEETFETYTTDIHLYTFVTPDCWTVAHQYTSASINHIGAEADTLPQIYRAFNHTEEGHYSLRMKFRSILAMPELDGSVDLNRLRLQMYVRQPQTYYKLQVGLMTELGNPDSFVPVALVNNGDKTMTYFECGFKSALESLGDYEHLYIAFKNIGGSANDPYCSNYLDDITLTYVDSVFCVISEIPHVEDFESYHPEIESGATGVEPDCWEVIPEDVALSSVTKPQLYGGFNMEDGELSDDGAYSLRLKNRCVYAMPALSEDFDIQDLTMTFSLRQTKFPYRLQVGVVNNDGEFELVKTINLPVNDPVQEVLVDFAEYEGNGNRIAFRNTTNNHTTIEYSTNYIDDININYTSNVEGRNLANDDNVIDNKDAYLESIAVYPNPTTGNLYIDAMDVQKVECYNQMGQLVGVYDNANELNISDLSNGVYMLRITVPQGVTMRKVVKK